MNKDYTMYHKLIYENSENFSRNFDYIPSSFGGMVGP